MDQVLDDVEFKQFTEFKKALEMRGNLIFQKRKYFFSKQSPVKLKSRDISPENNPGYKRHDMYVTFEHRHQ